MWSREQLHDQAALEVRRRRLQRMSLLGLLLHERRMATLAGRPRRRHPVLALAGAVIGVVILSDLGVGGFLWYFVTAMLIVWVVSVFRAWRASGSAEVERGG